MSFSNLLSMSPKPRLRSRKASLFRKTPSNRRSLVVGCRTHIESLGGQPGTPASPHPSERRIEGGCDDVGSLNHRRGASLAESRTQPRQFVQICGPRQPFLLEFGRVPCDERFEADITQE